jgi:GNAT superfamily N-acetyltransferase
VTDAIPRVVMPGPRMRISVVIPVLDDARMLERCLAALGTQTRPADEVIVVDNGSADDSADVARRAGASVVSEPLRGIWSAAARGFDAATGDVIARLDADSRPDPSWLARIESRLDARPDAVAITGPGRFYDLGQPLRAAADLLYMRAYFWSTGGALAARPLFGSNLALRRSVWIDVGPSVHRHDPEVHDDMDLSYHLHPAWPVLYDGGLRVGISARPLRDARGMALRMRRAVHTIRLHGDDRPTPRWERRIVARRAGGPGPFQVTPTGWDDPAGAALRLAQRAELDARYGGDDHEPGSPPTADDIAHFLVARDATGRAAGCGALRMLGAGAAEIKRMYVAPYARGTGVAGVLLGALEDEARRRGLSVLRLETGTEQPDAIRFYLRHGYHAIESFGAYIGSDISLCYEKTL